MMAHNGGAVVTSAAAAGTASVSSENAQTNQELDKAFVVCSDIIDFPPEDYR
jgi:hypothetical protein